MAIEATPGVALAGQSTHVVLLACPSAGHVLLVAELARRIVAQDGFTAMIITYTIPNFSSAGHYASIFASLPSSVTMVLLPEVSVDDLPANARVKTLVITIIKRAVPQVRSLLRSLLDSPAGVAAVVPDLFCTWALEVVVELGVPRYIFFPSNLMALCSLLYTPELGRTTTCEFRDLPELIRLPGCVPLNGVDLMDIFRKRANPLYPLMVELTNKDIGLVVPLWAPQVEILNHRAASDFISHCGSNSTVEAAGEGMPMISWPLYAEQRMNAVMLSERVDLALRPRAREKDGVVPRDEVSAVMTGVMTEEKGAVARKKVSELREAAKEAQASDGPSRKALQAVADK